MKTITAVDYQYYADIVCKAFSRLTGFATEIESPYSDFSQSLLSNDKYNSVVYDYVN
jgi:hypothetical protein